MSLVFPGSGFIVVRTHGRFAAHIHFVIGEKGGDILLDGIAYAVAEIGERVPALLRDFQISTVA